MFEVLHIYDKSGKKFVRVILELPQDVYLELQDLADYLGMSPTEIISELISKRWHEIFSEKSSSPEYSSVMEKFIDLVSKLEMIVSLAETYVSQPSIQPKRNRGQVHREMKPKLSPLVTAGKVADENTPDLDQVLDSVAVVAVDDSLLKSLVSENKSALTDQDRKEDSNPKSD